MKPFTLALMSLFLAAPVAAQDPLSDMQSLVEIGAFGTDLPAARLTAEQCTMTMRLEAVSPDLGVPLEISWSADARDLQPAAFTPDPKDDRYGIWIPRTDMAPANMIMTLATDDPAVRQAFGGALGVTCPDEGSCSAIQATPRLPVVFHFADGSDRARDFSTAMQQFIQTCEAAADAGDAGADAADPLFAALAEPLTLGTTGEPGSSSLTRVDGCTLAVDFIVEADGVPFHGAATYDMAQIDGLNPRISSNEIYTNIFLRRAEGATDVWSAELSAAAEHAEPFLEMNPAGTCDETLCVTAMGAADPVIVVIGADHAARAEAAAAALVPFRAACME